MAKFYQNKDVRITDDGFIWRIIPKEAAYLFFGDVCALYEDGTETEIDNEEELKEHNADVYGINVGYIDDLLEKVSLIQNKIIYE